MNAAGARLKATAPAGKELAPLRERITVDITELIGKNVLVRTVTHYYTGKLASAGAW